MVFHNSSPTEPLSFSFRKGVTLQGTTWSWWWVVLQLLSSLEWNPQRAIWDKSVHAAETHLEMHRMHFPGRTEGAWGKKRREKLVQFVFRRNKTQLARFVLCSLCFVFFSAFLLYFRILARATFYYRRRQFHYRFAQFYLQFIVSALYRSVCPVLSLALVLPGKSVRYGLC